MTGTGKGDHAVSIIKDHEWQYNPRVSTSDVDAYQHRAAEHSQFLRERLNIIRDVPYGDGEDETVDVFPAAPGAPIHLFLHGGYWRGRDKSDYSYLAGTLNEAGVTAVIANYSLCPKVSVLDIIYQTQLCLNALPEIANRFECDPQKATASGHSAGAHLLAAALFLSDPASAPPGNLQTATLISGIYDLTPVLGISINETIGLRREEIRKVSPMAMTPRLDVGFDIIVGGAESSGWIAQSVLFSEKCEKSGMKSSLIIEPGENHYSIMEAYASSDSGLAKRWLAQANLV